MKNTNAIEYAYNTQELFDKIEMFRDVNMVAGGHDPLQDGNYSLTDLVHTFRITTFNYESIKNELLEKESRLENWEIINL